MVTMARGVVGHPCAGHQPLQSLAALFQGLLAKVAPVQVQEVEGDQGRAGGVGRRPQCLEVAVAMTQKRDRLAVEERVVHAQSADRIGYPPHPLSEICAMTAPERNAIAFFPRDQPVSVMLDLMYPAGAARWR